MRKQNQKGFSLIELLIVVAIILIIAAIAIPNLMRSKIAANDSAAAANVRTLTTSEITYNTTYPTAGFATLSALGPGAATCGTPTSTAACLVDFLLGCAAQPCTKDNFIYTINLASSNTDYIISALPLGTTVGDKDFCSIPDGVVRWQPDPTGGKSAPTTDSGCTGGSYTPL